MLGAIDVLDNSAGPVILEYQTGISDHPDQAERIQTAVLTTVGILFESRGTLPPKGWDRAVQTLLPDVLG